MGFDAVPEILLFGFPESESSALAAALAALGKSSMKGDPVNDVGPAFVFAAARDEVELRGQRAAALDDPRPWCFCVPEGERALVAAAASAREGRLLLLPVDERELKRLLSALAEEAMERASGDAAFSGLERLEASFSWKTADFAVTRASRRFAKLLSESGFNIDRSAEDQCALALEEALVNSIEHGNLALDSSLRPDDPLAEDRYEAERERRLADPAYGGRLVRLSVEMDGREARIAIEDEGAGFDTSKIDAEPSGLDVSGKGFWLIKRPFDAASYNAKGNRLTLVKRKRRA